MPAKIYAGINETTDAKERFPLPSVVIYCPAEPPVAYKLLIGPTFVIPEIVALPDILALPPVTMSPLMLAELAVILPSNALRIILPVVRPFLTIKFFVLLATVPFSL